MSIIWYVVLTALSEDILADSLVALGFMIAFYYALTGLACVVYYRKILFKSVKNFLFVGLSPFLGAAMLAYIFYEAVRTYADPANSESGDEWLGVGPPLVIGVAMLLFGIPMMLMWWARHREFFQRRTVAATELPASSAGGGS